MAAKVVTIVGDVTGPQQRHTHKIYLHLVNKIKGVSKYCNKSKTLGGGGVGSSTPLYQGAGMNLHLRPRVKT